MKALPQLSILLFALLTGIPFAAHAADDEDMGSDCTYRRPDFKDRSIPKFQRAGEVMLAGGLKIPAYSLSMDSGILEEGELQTYTPGKPNPEAMKLKPEFANQLDAYATPMGMVLVPRGWMPVDASEGADGSFYIYFAPDTSGQTYLSISNTSACVGCAYMSASLYFDEARNLAKENTFPYCRASRAVHAVPLNPTQKAYRIVVTEGNPVDGLAYFDSNEDEPYYDVRISVPAAQHALASAILNQFVLSKKSK